MRKIGTRFAFIMGKDKTSHNSEVIVMIKIAATVLAMLLTMPIAYAMLDQIPMRIRLKGRIGM